MIKIGLMGGTFDPIHYGHLILAEQAREQFGLDKVLFVTAKNPPHKTDQVVTDVVHRHKMTCLAVEDNKYFEPSTVEIEREGPSYTIDTIKQIYGIYGADSHVYLLIGADEAQIFMSWRNPHGILDLATVAVANRPGASPGEVLAVLPDDVAERIVPLEMPGVDISSTNLRERVQLGRSIRYLVPDSVDIYIKDSALYRGN